MNNTLVFFLISQIFFFNSTFLFFFFQIHSSIILKELKKFMVLHCHLVFFFNFPKNISFFILKFYIPIFSIYLHNKITNMPFGFKKIMNWQERALFFSFQIHNKITAMPLNWDCLWHGSRVFLPFCFFFFCNYQVWSRTI